VGYGTLGLREVRSEIQSTKDEKIFAKQHYCSNANVASLTLEKKVGQHIVVRTRGPSSPPLRI
jgi:hypothetical protein